jgi:PhnB protein
MAKVKPTASRFQALTPYIIVRDGARALNFYKAAFGAQEHYRLTEPGGRIGHAEFQIGDSRLMLADEYPDFGAVGPITLGGSPVKLHLQVQDVDAFVKRAIGAGATELRAVKDEFHGNRGGMLADPFGHQWFIATRIEEISPEEMQRRFSAVMAG